MWIEVGYDLEQWITDGFAGETSRLYMVPGVPRRPLRRRPPRRARRASSAGSRRAATSRFEGVPRVRASRRPRHADPALGAIILLFIAILVLSRIGGGPRGGVRRWGAGGWSGWSSGVGPFGGGFGGGGGGGFGGGFGGFGGGRSGGGGGGASW